MLAQSGTLAPSPNTLIHTHTHPVSRHQHTPPAPRAAVARVAALPVLAKQNAKQRERLAEAQRSYNRQRRSAIATRMKKVFKAIVAVGTPAAEADLAPVEALISEAYQEIDKAVQKGVLHSNTGARRKARLAAAKRAALIKGGLYTPA